LLVGSLYRAVAAEVAKGLSGSHTDSCELLWPALQLEGVQLGPTIMDASTCRAADDAFKAVGKTRWVSTLPAAARS